MKSRIISLTLIFLLLITAFAGCASKEEQPGTTGATAGTATSAESTTADASSETEKTADAEAVTELTTEETEKETETEAKETEKPATTQATQPTQAATQPTQATTAPTTAPTTAAPTTTSAPEPTESVDKFSTAKQYIGQSVSALYAAIGRPNGSSYATGCAGDCEDGELYYTGFVVYTHRYADGSEIVYDVDVP